MEAQMTKWALSAGDIEGGVKELMNKTTGMYDEISALQGEKVSEALSKLTEVHRYYDSLSCLYDFPSQVSADKAVRDASVEADRVLSDFSVAMSARKDVFDVMCSYGETYTPPTPESVRLLARVIRDGKRVGLHLEKAKQDRIKEINSKMSSLGIEFQNNMNEDKTAMFFKTEQLKGCSEDFVKGLERNEAGEHKVTLQYPCLYPILKQCSVEATRKQLLITRYSMCKDLNTPILEELVKLRAEKAGLLGYPTHSDFILDARMAKTKDTVKTFLTDMVGKMKEPLSAEFEGFLEIKERECKENGEECCGSVQPWDIYHYMQITEKEKYSVDTELLKQYFPMDIVTKGLLEIYQLIFNLRFEKIENAPVWHPDVQLFSVFDKTTSAFLGQFYMDLHPRDGKYGHAAVFGLQPGCVKSDGERQPAVCALVCNFTAPTADKPSLLYHSEVETYFHEFGHAMHQICSQTEHTYFSGTRVERDFVEAPSQMLENWCWEKDSLKMMSGHYKDGTAIPCDLLEKLVCSKLANVATTTCRQLVFGLFDQDIHTRENADTAQCFSNAHSLVMGNPAPEGTNFAAQFGHMAGGYDAQYYGYMWSEVYSEDMFQTVFKETGVLSPEGGMKYRTCILQPGGSVDAFDMLKNMLGRDPNSDAFFKAKGFA